MKKIFKKAVTVFGSAILIGATVGMAAAASYPTPFTSNTAIVIGANAAPSDNIAAASIASNLDANAASSVTSGATTFVGGDSAKLQRPSTLLHIGDGLSTVFGRAVTNNDMPNLLTDGSYRDSANNDHDYTQKIEVANLALQDFDLSQYDSNYSDSTPTIGMPIASGDNVLNYTLTFQDNVNTSEMANTNLDIMGKEYYVLSATDTSMTMLDSGSNAIVAEGTSKTVNVGTVPYSVSINFVSSTQVILTINGENTNTLKEGDTYKLKDGSYVGIKSILYSSKDSGVSKVEFSIGSGKLQLIDNSNIQVNGNSVDGITTEMSVGTNGLNKLSLIWDTSNDVAVTPSESLVMPVFNSVKLSLGDMTYPASEKTSVRNDGNTAVQIKTTMKNGPVTFDILGSDKTTGNFTTIGKDSRNLIETSSTEVLNYNGTYSTSKFIVSWMNGKDAESYMLSVNGFVNDSGTLKATIQSKDGGNINQQVQDGDSITLGNVVLDVTNISKTAKTITLTGNTGVTFNRVYTADGLQILLPTLSMDASAGGIQFNSTINVTTTTGIVNAYPIQFAEEDKDGNIASVNKFNLTVVANTGSANSYQTSVNGISGAGNGIEDGNTNVYEYVVNSPLATAIKLDEGPTQQTAEITYHGSESYNTAYLTASTASASSSSSGEAGVMTVKDSNVANVAGKNLVVVGGSAINSVAASLLGGAYSGTMFTSATGVGEGQFLIQSFNRNGNTALLVAGYNAADTAKATTYLLNNNVNTTVGNKMVGTSATSATIVTA